MTTEYEDLRIKLEIAYEAVYDLISVTTMTRTAKDVILSKLEKLWQTIYKLQQLMELVGSGSAEKSGSKKKN